MSGWQLVLQQGPRPGLTFDLDRPVITIGREVNNEIVIEDSQVSRHHTRLTQQGAGYVVEDLGSTNGTFVNGQRVTGTRPINSGDTLGLGDTVVLQVMGMAGAGETVVAHAQAQPMVTAPMASVTPPPSFSAPPPPDFGVPLPPPPPPPDFGAPPPPPAAKKSSRTWLWACGCLVLLCLVCSAVSTLLYFNPGPLNALLKTLGVDMTFQ
jgi:predicted component of type VI protein secretion system